MEIKKYSIEKDFVVLDSQKVASIETFNTTLYQRLAENYGDFSGCELISCHEFSEDWTSWEIHPNGDEIVILLSGSATFVLQLETEEKQINLSDAGSYVVVPRNVWHTVKVVTQTKMLFITPGEGTQHRGA